MNRNSPLWHASLAAVPPRLPDRLRERMASIVGAPVSQTEPATSASITIAPALKPRAELTAGQLQWCKDWIPGFESHSRQVAESDRHRAEMRAAAGLGA